MVWDLPTRLFHWSFVVSIIGAYVSGENDATAAHEYFGLAAFGLLVFRLIWGFIGHETARFISFIKPLGLIVGYLVALVKRTAPHYAGHNPAGGLAVIALLSIMAAMAVTGLWTGDDILYEGPLTAWAPELFVDWAPMMGNWHEELHILVIPIVALHVLAIIVHRLWLREKLVSRMISGRDFEADPPSPIDPRRTRLGLVLLAVCLAGSLSLSLLTPSY